MNYKLLSVLVFIISSALNAAAQSGHDSAADSITHADAPAKKYGKFNYTYIRVGVVNPSAGFANPIASGFQGSEHFSVKTDLKNRYRLAYESGKVRHFNKLHLGTEMLKLGINSGVAFQAFGAAKNETATTSITTDGQYVVRLGIGPQLTFKPIEDFRIGVYYRAGIGIVYSNYKYDEATQDASNARANDMDIHLLNYAYNGEVGVDFSWHVISVGVSYAMMRITPSKGALVDARADNKTYNAYQSSVLQSGVTTNTLTSIDPKLNFNRLVLTIGFAF